MFSNHSAQMVHLKNPEFPKVFTNFEDQVGEYSVAYKRAQESFTIIAKIIKNQFNYDLIVQYRNGLYDILHYNLAHNITEDYGYKVNDCLADKSVGDEVSKDSFIYKSDNYDDDGNFSYGVNVQALYIPWRNLTYEDGLVISKSAAEKFTSFKVEKTMLSINGNDILLNLYGDDNTYKSFPKVGDETNSEILVASRRRDKRTVLYDLQSSRMKKVDPINDDITYTGGGKVVDIDVFSNVPINELRKKTDTFNKEILSVVENNLRYWTEMADELEKIIPCKILTETEIQKEKSEFGHVAKHPEDHEKNKNRYTDELAYYWKLSHENIDEKIQWRYDGKSFDNFKVQFTILKENRLVPGSKLTGRYGNKSIVAKIENDDEMPTTVDGQKAEVLLNPLGIINRLNPSQIQEQFINFMSDHVVNLMKQTGDYHKKADIFFSFLEAINKKEYDFFDIEYIGMNRSEQHDFLDRIEQDGIYIHQPPFFGNTTEEQFRNIFINHPEWCSDYKFVGIEKPMTMGQIYFIRLKHEPSNKTSIRSAANLNVKSLPAKSTLKKEKKILYSTNPLRLGEMEVTNLLITKSPRTVEKLLKTYSTNETLREETITQLLSPGKLPNGHLKNSLNMSFDFDLDNNHSISREILEKYLNVLGYSLIDNVNDKSSDSKK